MSVKHISFAATESGFRYVFRLDFDQESTGGHITVSSTEGALVVVEEEPFTGVGAFPECPWYVRVHPRLEEWDGKKKPDYLVSARHDMHGGSDYMTRVCRWQPNWVDRTIETCPGILYDHVDIYVLTTGADGIFVLCGQHFDKRSELPEDLDLGNSEHRIFGD